MTRYEKKIYRNQNFYPTLGWIFSENALLGHLFGFCYIEFIEDASNE